VRHPSINIHSQAALNTHTQTHPTQKTDYSHHQQYLIQQTEQRTTDETL